jgi:hypothetical protein
MTTTPQKELIPEDVWAKLIWLIILMPGFACLTLAISIADAEVSDEFRLTFYSLFLSFVIAILAGLIHLGLGKRKKSAPNRATFLAVVTILTLIMGAFVGIAVRNDWLFIVLRNSPFAGAIDKVSNRDPLRFMLDLNKKDPGIGNEGDGRDKDQRQAYAWVVIETTQGKVYSGWPRKYGSAERPQMWLSPACAAKSNAASPAAAEMEKVPGPGMVIFGEEISTVTFLDRLSSNCYKAWNP